MKPEISIIDIGRGPQLSTSRITVQDVVPYFQLHYSYDEIREVMPSLSIEEIKVIERFFEENRDEMLDIDRRIRERNANRKNSSEVQEILNRAHEKLMTRMAALKQRRAQGRNGEWNPG